MMLIKIIFILFLFSTVYGGASKGIDGDDAFKIDSTVASRLTSNFTWEAWVYPLDITNTGMFWSYTAGVIGGGMGVYVEGSVARWEGDFGAYVTGNWTTVFQVNEWQHLSLVFQSDNVMRLRITFLDGTAPQTFNAMEINPMDAWVGDINFGFRDWVWAENEVYYDEVRYWDVAKTTVQIDANRFVSFNKEKNLIGNWKFNEPLGRLINWANPDELHLTSIVGAPFAVSDGAPIKRIVGE